PTVYPYFSARAEINDEPLRSKTEPERSTKNRLKSAPEFRRRISSVCVFAVSEPGPFPFRIRYRSQRSRKTRDFFKYRRLKYRI
ncbi:Hypothetical protein CINCED_3A017512, partial [Cinara cedri]